MDAQQLVLGEWPARAAAAALLLLPALFILFSRRSNVWAKLAWLLAMQLPLAFVAIYVWVWVERYGVAVAPDPAPTAGALGWWTFAFPWAVYLLYRATRRRFSGEPGPAPPP